VKALILAGGFATRLRPLSCARPKTLFPIVNKPLLQWIFEGLAEDGVTEAIMAVNALTQFHIRQQKPSKCGLKVRFSIDPPKKPLGTGGPIKKAEKLLGHEEPFIVLNGDIFAEIDYKKMLDVHKKTKAIATVALCCVEDPSSFGVVEFNGENIKRFVEKPPKGQAPSNLINAGAYVLSPEIFNYIPKGRPVSIEREVFPKLAEANKLSGCKINGLWMDIGKPHEYLQANKTVLDTIGGTLEKPKPDGFKVNHPVAFDKGVSIGEKSIIGPYAILGKNVKIGKNVTISNSVIFSEVVIEDDVTIEGAVVGESVHVGKNVKLEKGCIVGDLCKIRPHVDLHENSAVCPAKEIS
jgi:mannose-1-phosphate guanylyltransferase